MHHQDASVFRGRKEPELDRIDGTDAIQGSNQVIGSLSNPASTPVDDLTFRTKGGEIESQGNLTGLQFDPNSGGLYGSPRILIVPEVLSKPAQMAHVGSNSTVLTEDAHHSRTPPQSEEIHDRSRGCLQRSLPL